MLSDKAMSTLDRDAIAARIPHTGTMCLLDSADRWNDESIRCTTESHRRSPHPLAAAGRLGIANTIEYAAQAMALHGALSAAAIDRPRAGFLASVRGVEFFADRLDDIAAPLTVEAERLSGDGNSVIYGFRVAAGERTLAQGRAAVVLDAGARLEQAS
ncbi:MAG TPA: 3-hydroxylacyl-ACP dehydratase [Rhodocyclaceae bacterium]